MEDTIEICAGCGKLPRPIDYLNGLFLCSRCGNNKIIMVHSEDYEKTAMKLDEKFHKKIIETRIAFVKEEDNPKKSKKKPAKKMAKKKAVKKPKKVKKAVKKAKKTPKKAVRKVKPKKVKKAVKKPKKVKKTLKKAKKKKKR